MPAHPTTYDVYTNADPEEISEVALDLYKEWLDFAEGLGRIGGRRLVHPTGRYAKSLRLDRGDLQHVAIIADEKVAPEALWLEVGHGSFDLKESLVRGKAYPIHRGGMLSWHPPSASGFQHPALGMEASHRGQFLVAWARVGGTGWIVPAMPAYEPGLHLAREAARRLGGRLSVS
jgi:hypothetical protein